MQGHKKSLRTHTMLEEAVARSGQNLKLGRLNTQRVPQESYQTPGPG